MSNSNHTFEYNTTAIVFASVRQNNYLTYYFVPLYAIVFFIGTFGNGLVIISILRSSRLRTVTNTYLLNIAIADFVLLLSVPLLIVTILANGWIFGNILCKMYYNFIHINQYVSSLLLAALSFDRYLAVCHPIRAIEFRTRTRCAIIIGGCWFTSILLLCPTWAFATVISEQYIVWFGCRVQKCVIDFPSIEFRIPPEILFTYYAFLFGFLVPVSMITTFYILLLVRLNHIGRKHKSGLKQRSHRKVTRIVLAVVTAYFICWLPYWFLQIFITIDPLIHSFRLNFSIFPANTSLKFLKELTHLTTIMGYANNCLNPILYVFLSDSFREEYLFLLKCFSHRDSAIENSLQLHNSQKHIHEHEINREQATKTGTRVKEVLKNLKHSIASDEAPSNNASFPLILHRVTNRKSCPPLCKTPGKNDNDEHANDEYRTLCHTDGSIRKIDYTQKQVFKVKLSLSENFSTFKMTDDGGVYCGH